MRRTAWTVGILAVVLASCGGGGLPTPGAGPEEGARSGEESVWVTSVDDDLLVRLAPDLSRVIERIDVGRGPGAVAVGEGAVWVVTEFGVEVTRVDATSNEVVATIPLATGEAQSIAVGEGAVWVATSRGALFRIDPSTNEVTTEIDIIESSLFQSSWVRVAVGEGAVWQTTTVDRQVVRIDPGAGSVVHRMDVDYPTHVAVGSGSIWVTTSTAEPDRHTLLRIDPSTNEVVATIDLDARTQEVVVADGAVWVSHGEPHLTRIDPSTNEVVATVDLDTTRHNVAYLAAGYDGVWAANSGDFTVSLIDPSSNEIVAEHFVDAPRGIAVG